MIKGLYTAASGMMVQMARQDAIANNLANVNTSGYKKHVAVSRAFPEMLMSRLGESTENARGETKAQPPEFIGRLGTGACMDEVYTDFTAGNIKKTDNSSDIALSGPGFFAVETADGERFTRCGEFKINSDGMLTTSEGYPVLDNFDNYIFIEDEFTVDRLGNIIVNGEEIARLKIINFENLQAMERLGDSLLNSNEEYMEIENPDVLQGYVEESNVNAVKEMVTLISVVRAYEAMQKAVQAVDETTQVALDKVGSVT